ncbi:MAG: helix-turn-helix domain-containing protein, partial [Candidatus Gastranaerophilales bacterium]|nr:helix-turn-helix domain-containing protein [Candidatus Gastranaerophilales bacterium]
MENNTDIKKLPEKRIKECRKEKGLKQEKLTGMIRLGVRNVSKIECKDNFLIAETLSKIISALKIEPVELFDFSRYDDTKKLKEELLKSIRNDQVDKRLLYRINK